MQKNEKCLNSLESTVNFVPEPNVSLSNPWFTQCIYSLQYLLCAICYCVWTLDIYLIL